MTDTPRPRILTGDRPTGPLHLGHLAGSLRSRVALQASHETFILVADLQALTDRAERAGELTGHVLDVMADYLAVGLDPAHTTFCRQSGLPALAELTVLLLNLVSVAQLERNPTVRHEIGLRGFRGGVPAGFLCYPVSQCADILGFKADLVPVGADQLPMVELAQDVAERFAHLYAPIFPRPEALLPESGERLPGIDGKAKASKSLGNAIPLGADDDTIREAVMRMFTDPGHLRAADPGRVEGNVVFAYLRAFDPDQEAVAALEDRYRAGGLGDVAVKRRLIDVLSALLAPIRARRLALRAAPDHLATILRQHTERAADLTAGVMAEVRQALGLNMPHLLAA